MMHLCIMLYAYWTPLTYMVDLKLKFISIEASEWFWLTLVASVLHPCISTILPKSSTTSYDRSWYCRTIVTTRAHSFPRAAEFRAEPRDFGFLPRDWAAEFHCGISSFPRYFDVFHSNNYFLTEIDLKVALLQVFLWWFFVWWWWLNDEIDD